jgi:hypothetical protein
LAVANGLQTLDVPVVWAFSRHHVGYEDFGLRPDQADLAASVLETTATFVVAGVIRDALVYFYANPKNHDDPDVVAAYQISRLMRNAFSHSMLAPRWSIDEDCKGKTYTIDKVISVNTTDLHGKELDWRHFGGPLAIFYFGRFVREQLLGDKVDPNRRKPNFPTEVCYQQGRLILRRSDELPPGLVEVASAAPGESLDLGNGHRMYVPPVANGPTRLLAYPHANGDSDKSAEPAHRGPTT